MKQRFAEETSGAGGPNARSGQFKSWLLLAGLTAEGHGQDALACTREAWRHMQFAPNAGTSWTADVLSNKMIRHLTQVGRLPEPNVCAVAANPSAKPAWAHWTSFTALFQRRQDQANTEKESMRQWQT